MIDAKLWKNLIGAIATLVDEASFDIGLEGIKLRAMDPSHVAMIDFEWPKIIFDDYICDKPTKLCVNINEMLKLLRRVSGDESIEIEAEPSTAQVKITLISQYTRTFRMATLESLSEAIPTPKISFSSKVRITTGCLKNAVEDGAIVSDSIQLETTGQKFIMQATGDFGSATVEVKKESEEILSFQVKEDSKATYSLNYLSDMVKAGSSISDITTIEFSTDMPLRLNFELPQNGKLQYYLAPRIESH